MRVSTDAQDHDSQAHALSAAGIHPAATFADVVSGRGKDKPQLARAIATLSPGDELVVVRLDRLTRGGIGPLHDVLRAVEGRGARVRSLHEPWLDPSSPAYGLLVSVFAWLAEQEAARTRERTEEGLAAARARGVQMGRPRALTAAQEREAVAMIESGRSGRAIMDIFKVSRSTVKRLAARARSKETHAPDPSGGAPPQ